MLTQRGLVIAIGVILFIFLWAGIWFFFFRSKEDTVVEEIQINTVSGQLSVFAGKGETNKVIATVGRGETLQVLEKSDTWYKVRLANGEIGYINGALLISAFATSSGERSQPGSGQPGLPIQPGQLGTGEEKVIGVAYVNIKSGYLNLRVGKGTNYESIAKLLKGEKVEILDNSDIWYKVRLPNGTIGYAHSQYLRAGPP